MKIKRIAASAFICIFMSFSALAESYGSKQLIPAGHWIYDALFRLYTESATVFIADSAPLSVEAIRMHLDFLDYDSLSYSGKILYEKVNDYLNEKKPYIDWTPLQIGFNLKIHPTLMFKTNSDINWSFASDYGSQNYSYEKNEYEIIPNTASNPTAPYTTNIKKTETKKNEYINESFYKGDTVAPFLSLPIYLNFADAVFIETEPRFAKSAYGMSKDGNWNNITFDGGELDFLWPVNAYASTGYIFKNDNWFKDGMSFNFNVSKTGYQNGRSMTGNSIIYNDTFQTDVNVHLDLTTKNFRYEMNVAEVDHTKFLYLHSFDFIPFKWLKCGVVEGTQINAPFELRYLNPLMIMHSFGSWTEYCNDWEEAAYGEAHVCAYMGIKVEVVPCKNLRFYLLYSQNEITMPNEQGENGCTMPNSLGGQLGFELNIPESTGGWFTTGFEAIYTTPWLYLKQGSDWSLYRTRTDMQSGTKINSWLGTPYGPDALGFQLKFGYDKPQKWNAEFDYLFLAHGTNSFGLFSQKKKITVDVNGHKYDVLVDDYYPSVMYKTGSLTQEAAEELAAKAAPSGTVQFTNQFTFKGKYYLNKHFTFNSALIYTFILNNKNVSGDTAHGVEFSLGAEYKIY